jgi:hypothetical protein
MGIRDGDSSDPGWKKSDPVQTSRIRNTGFDKMPKLKRSSIPSQHVYLKSLRKHLLVIRTTDRKKDIETEQIFLPACGANSARWCCLRTRVELCTASTCSTSPRWASRRTRATKKILPHNIF